jgi:hypothetical protein
MSSASGTTALDSPVSFEISLTQTPTPPSLSSLPQLHPAFQPLPEERASIRPQSTPPDSPVQSQAEQPSDVLQAIVISFPTYLRATHGSFDVCEPGLLGKKVSRLYDFVDPQTVYSASNSTFKFGNSYLSNERTLSDYGIISGDTVMLNPNPESMRVMGRRCRKPIIYLYPPSSLPDVSVELTLTSSWRFSAVHPPPQATVPPGEPHTAQSLTWMVAAEPNGTLLDKTSGMDVSYLYWEAM